MKIRVQNMTSSSGRPVPNQFIIDTSLGTYFQSYNTVIVFIPNRCSNGELFKSVKTKLDRDKWDYSRTTGKYRNNFLMENKRETERKIADGTYELVDLN